MKPATRNSLMAAAAVLLAIAGIVIGRQLARQSTQSQAASVAAATEAAPSPTPTVTLRPVTPTPTATRTATPTPATPSATPTPATPIARTPGPTVAPDLAIEFTKAKPNQYLGTIARNYGVSVDEVVKFSGIENPDAIAIGQGLVIPHHTDLRTPDQVLIPDSEAIYGLGYKNFDLQEFVDRQGGMLSQFSMLGLDGSRWIGADVVERVAARYSVGPRVLLAIMEAQSGWVTDPDPQGVKRDYPLGHTNGAPGLLPQLEWTANELNHGFYGWMDRGETAIRFEDGTIVRGAPGLNPGTIAVQRALAGDTTYDRIEEETAGFSEAYRRLFGEPAALDAGPVLPAGLEQPRLHFPWKQGEWWHLTGGPHGAWMPASSWAAVDFVPETAGIGTCIPAPSWATAAAAGVVARENTGEILLDLDGDGDIRTGWVLQYLHIVDKAPLGARLEAGDPVGRPSCEGGAAEQTHLHFSRRYNGLMVAAGGPVPMVLDGWTTHGGFEYDGAMTKPGEKTREASHSRDREVNGLFREEQTQ